MEKKFSLCGVHISRKYIESMHFYTCPDTHTKLCFPQNERGGQN